MSIASAALLYTASSGVLIAAITTVMLLAHVKAKGLTDVNWSNVMIWCAGPTAFGILLLTIRTALVAL